MKNIFLSIIVSFLSSTALANMQVGDTAIYKVVSQGMTFEITNKVLEVSGMEVLVEETLSYQGQKQVDTFWESEDDLVSSEEGQMLVDNCANFGGALENINVAGKTLKTCRINDEQNPADFFNAAAVPFGMVKARQDDPQDGVTTVQLVKYINAK